MTGAIWLQAAITVPAALLVSLVSFLYRFRRNGHPFGSSSAARWAVAVILLAAAPTVAALFLPSVPPAYLGAAAPALLGVREMRLRRRAGPAESGGWLMVVTFGVKLLLDRLEQQMEADREQWADAQMGLIASLDQLEYAAMGLFDRLSHRTSVREYTAKLRSHRDAVFKAVHEARSADLRDDARRAAKARHSAEQSLIKMLNLVYEICPLGAAEIPRRSPPAGPVVGAECLLEP
jgi:hypothetical protein